MTVPLMDGDPARVGSYELLGRLGVGGMGVVFLGRSLGGRLVAVKLIRPELAADNGFRRRFTDEVIAARKVGGFYTAQVVDAAPDGNPAWLATAYIPGLSLQQAVTDHGPLPAASAAMLGAGLAEGLAAVHGQDLVHRDLKPANVILAPDGPRLIDFGIARALDATSYTQTHTVLGTAAFMSPEQATGDTVIGPPSDIFSLGCVLGFAGTGVSPFGTGPGHAIGYRIVHSDPDLTDLSRVSPPMAELVARCLVKAPEERPALDSVLHELADLARGQQGGQPTRWLPDDLTATIAQRATEVLNGTSVLPGQETPPGDAPSVGRSVREQVPAGQASAGPPEGKRAQRPVTDPATPSSRRAAASALISLVLLLCALAGAGNADGRATLGGFLEAAARFSPSAMLGCLLCAASVFLNTRHVDLLARVKGGRQQSSLRVPLSVVGGVVGFLTPVLAIAGLGDLLRTMVAPESDDGIFVAAALLVVLGLIVAVGLQLKSTWQSYAAAVTSLTLLGLAVMGMVVLGESGDNIVNGFVDALESWSQHAPRVAIPLMLAECAAGTYLYVCQAQWLVRSRIDKLGSTLAAGCSALAAVVGLLVPFLAFAALNELLYLLGGPLDAVGSWASGLILAVLLALGIGWHRESERTGRARRSSQIDRGHRP